MKASLIFMKLSLALNPHTHTRTHSQTGTGIYFSVQQSITFHTYLMTCNKKNSGQVISDSSVAIFNCGLTVPGFATPFCVRLWHCRNFCEQMMIADGMYSNCGCYRFMYCLAHLQEQGSAEENTTTLTKHKKFCFSLWCQEQIIQLLSAVALPFWSCKAAFIFFTHVELLLS